MIKNLRVNKSKLGAISSSILLSITLMNLPSLIAKCNQAETPNDTTNTSTTLNDENILYIYKVQRLIDGEWKDDKICAFTTPQESNDNIKYTYLGAEYYFYNNNIENRLWAYEIQCRKQKEEEDLQKRIDAANDQIKENQKIRKENEGKPEEEQKPIIPVNERDLGHGVNFYNQYSDEYGNLDDSVESITTDSTGYKTFR